MDPTWQSDCGTVRLWCADCREVLPTLPSGSVDAVVTDPPYENMKGGTVIDHAGVAPRIATSVTVGAELGTADGLVECKRLARLGAIAFCSYHWADKCIEMLGGNRRCLVSWFKRNAPYSVNNSPWFLTEYAWAVQYSPGIDWRNLRTHIDEPLLAAGCMANERVTESGKAVHPAQKPIAVMEQLICPGMNSICDPYMGLGTTGVAAARLGRRFFGIEREPKYFEIAKRRIQAALDSQPLFKEQIAETQGELWT